MSTKSIKLVSVVAIGLVGAWWLGSNALQHRGYKGLGDFLGQVLGNYPKSLDAEPLKLGIQVDESAYAQLESVVKQARATGVILPEGNDYVKARIETNGREFKAKVRIKGKLTDHVKNEKWSFRVLTRKGGAFNGMQRFSLQHPGTRNYLYEWFYHRMMAREGVINLQYGFVDVSLNKEPLGIYAYEEHFGQELLQRNKRPPGPIFRFDPGLYWIRRLHEMDGLRFREAYADHHAALIDAYDSGDIFKDSVRTSQFRHALLKMNALRSGQLSASEVFDYDKVALRHAIIDLIGGHHSMDWSDVKFYYDPVTDRIEPVAYESFSVQPLNQLAGSFRYLGRRRGRLELHDIFFEDELLFRRYVAHLERISSQDYLDSLFSELGPALDSVSRILYKEFPYKPLEKNEYYKNAAVIRATLDFPKGVHAFVTADGEGNMRFQFVPLSDLPVEVRSISVNGKVMVQNKLPVIPARKQGFLGVPVEYRSEIPDSLLSEYELIQVQWSVLGGSNVKSTGVLPMEYPSEHELVSQVPAVLVEASTNDYLIDSIDNTLTFVQGDLNLNNSLTIPTRIKSVARTGTHIVLGPGVILNFNGGVDWQGEPGNPVLIELAKGAGIRIEGGAAESAIRNVRFVRLDSMYGAVPLMTLVNAKLEVVNSSFAGAADTDLLLMSRSQFKARNVTLKKGKDLLRSYFCELDIDKSELHDATDDGLVVHGGNLRLNSSLITKIEGDALKLDASVGNIISGLHVEGAETAMKINNGASVSVSSTTMNSCALGIKTDDTTEAFGKSTVNAKDIIFEDVPEHFRIGTGSEVNVDGELQSISNRKGT